MNGAPLAIAPAARGSDVGSADDAEAGSRLEATRMSLLEALALGPAAWDAMPAPAGSPSPFMSWAWHRAWADAAPTAEVAASEALVQRDAGGSVHALLPVLLRRLPFHRVHVTALTWATGDLGCPDHLDMLAASDANVGALGAILRDLPWQLLRLSNLAPNASRARTLCESIAGPGYTLQRRPLWVCPYLELCDDWEGYLATLTPTRRQTLRRKERNLRRDHAVTITDYCKARVDEGLSNLMTLHERRWVAGGGRGAFQDASVRQLHRRFAAELDARGQLWLTTLDLDGEPAAAWYGFTSGDTVYFYQSGRDPRWDRATVGQVLMAAMIRRAIERGYRRFDFLRGEDPYKRLWTTTQRITEEITIFRPGWRGRWLRALDAAAQVRGWLRRERTRGRDSAGQPQDG